MEDMLETPEIDVEKVMEQIRENVRKRRQEFPLFKTVSPLPTDQVATDLTSLHRGYDIYPLRFTSHRRVLGRFVILAKKILQQLLTPILERQLAYNVANSRLTSSLWEQVEILRQQQAIALQALQEQLEGLAQQHTGALQTLRAERGVQGAAVQEQAGALQALRTELGVQGAAVQEQAGALQALRAERGVQGTAVQEQQATLRAELGVQGAAVQEQAEALQALRTELGVQGAAVQEQQATLRTELGMQGAAVQEQAGALQALRTELGVQGAAVQEQAGALQALRTELGMQGAAVQEQAEALQALRTELGVQGAAVQEQAGALQALRTELGAQGAGVHQQQAEVSQTLRAEAEKNATEWTARIVEWERIVARLKTESILQERRITLLLEEARKRLPDTWDQEQLQSVADEEHHVLDALYVSFEDQFRGTREDIKERLRVYLSILQEANLGSETRPILDVGCGRGEWLELLQEAGLLGQGVDRNRVLVEQGQKRGLRVVESDVLAYLRSFPDASLGAVTGFHIIEHLPLEILIKLLDETVRVLTSGGLAIFETPNPRNVLVGSHNFYLDPTHRHPLPSSMMKFMAEARGLCRVRIIELHPCPEASRVQEANLDVAKRFNEYFYGPQDYAVVGWKA